METHRLYISLPPATLTPAQVCAYPAPIMYTEARTSNVRDESGAQTPERQVWWVIGDDAAAGPVKGRRRRRARRWVRDVFCL